MQTYTRVASLFEGARTLIEAGFPEEAVILGRELFTDSLHLMDIAGQKPDARRALLAGTRNELYTRWESVVKEALATGEETEAGATEVLAAVERGKKNVQAYQAKHGIKKLRSFRHEKQLARDLGRGKECLHFELAHLMVHRADFVQPMRTGKKGDIRMLHLRSADPSMVVAAAVFVMRSAVYAHKAAASVLSWSFEPPQAIDDLLSEIDALEVEASGT
jgi:hypothetical protein